MECRVVKKSREPKGVRSKKTLTPWNGVVDNRDDYEGFVYCITRNDGKYYVVIFAKAMFRERLLKLLFYYFSQNWYLFFFLIHVVPLLLFDNCFVIVTGKQIGRAHV